MYFDISEVVSVEVVLQQWAPTKGTESNTLKYRPGSNLNVR